MTDALIILAVLLWITTIGPLTIIYLPRHIRGRLIRQAPTTQRKESK